MEKKMKKKYLFCTNPLMYLTEVPPIVLFIIALRYNKYSESLAGFYPLMIFLGLVTVFIFIYLFRMISLSFEEIRYHGRFSSRDRAEINEGKELIITLLPKRRFKIELFGNDGTLPEYSWINQETGKPIDIFLFRGKAIGAKRKVISILRYFGVDEDGAELVFENEEYSADYELVSLNSKIEEEKTTVRLKIKQTV